MTLTVDPPDIVTGFFAPDPADLARERDAVAADLGGRYRVDGFIARGGFASVWQAVDTVAGRPVAVKRIDPRVGRGRDFFRELRAMFRLDHPNVVRIVNFLEAGATRYLILELCAGGSLRAAVSALRRGDEPADPAAVREVVRQVAGGLAAAHRLGLTHRDLKPENVLFGDKRRGPLGGGSPAKLADFGLATLLAPDDTGPLKSLTGSPAYMAPEQFTGGFAPASDVYALGVIAAELLTGELVFTGTAEQLAYQHLRQEPTLPAGLPAAWAELLPAMLAKRPADRPTAGQVAERLASRAVELPAKAVALVERPAGDDTEFVAVGDGVALSLRERTAGVWEAVEQDKGRFPVAEREGYFTADGRGYIARFDGREVAVLDADTHAAVWSRSVPAAGLRPKFARLADGGFACTDFVDGPGLRFLGPDGTDRGRVPLPGICWHLRPWAAAAAARVLTGRGFQACRATPAGARLLSGSTGVALLATGGRGGPLVGGWANGTITAWRPDGAKWTRPRSEAGTLTGLATDGRRIAALWDGCRVSVVEVSTGGQS